MTELLQSGSTYTFYLANRKFIATFVEICPPCNTLVVSKYVDENGYVPGTRTMPFNWVNRVEIVHSETDVDTIHLDKVSDTTRQVYSRDTHINNYMIQ